MGLSLTISVWRPRCTAKTVCLSNHRFPALSFEGEYPHISLEYRPSLFSAVTFKLGINFKL